MISIVYQYYKHDGDFQEIYYSIESILRNFRADHFKIHFIGDKPEGINAHHIHHPMGDIKRTPWYDVALKMEMILDCDKISKRFIMMHDDMYLINPITNLDQIAHFYYLGWPDQRRIYHTLLHSTKQVLEEKGVHAYNCETHLPRMYNKNKMREVWSEYKPKENALVYSTLYFNHHHPHNKKTKILTGNKIKAGFYGRDDESSYSNNLDYETMKKVIDNKLFLNHNDLGLTENLKRYIHEKFKK